MALAMAVQGHDPDDPLPIRHMQSDTYYGQVVQAIDDDIAKQVLCDLEQTVFEDEGGLVLQSDKVVKAKGVITSAKK